MIERAQRYAGTLEGRSIYGFNVRMGINTESVVMGEVGSGLRVQYTAIRDGVNPAARTESVAWLGTILIT